MDDDGEIETKGVRARPLATLWKRRQRETDKTEAKRPKTAESHVFEPVEITLTLGHLSLLSLALNLHVSPPSTRSKFYHVHTQPRLLSARARGLLLRMRISSRIIGKYCRGRCMVKSTINRVCMVSNGFE